MTEKISSATPQQEKILILLAATEGRVLLKLKERRGSFGLFEDGQRIGEYLFHPAAVVSACAKGFLGGSPVHGYHLTSEGRKYLERSR